MSDADQYIKELAEYVEQPEDDYIYTEVELPDSIAARMYTDPHIEIVSIEKGAFGLDSGTMIVDFRVKCDG